MRKLLVPLLAAACWLIIPPHSAVASVAVTVVTGELHTCAISKSGALYCWGDTSAGQLGTGKTPPYANTRPGLVVGLSGGVSAVDVGEYNTCAATTAGSALCWGRNTEGQVGDGSTTQRETPVQVAGLSSGTIAIAVGGGTEDQSGHSCALLQSGSVMCWGSNRNGQLGIGTDLSQSSTPIGVVGLSAPVVEITAGDVHTCALLDDGSVACWGANGGGQLGVQTAAFCDLGTCSRSPIAVSISDLRIKKVVAFSFGTCAIDDIGALFCWGVGFGPTPAPVKGFDHGVVDVSAGSGHYCVVTEAGQAACWGENTAGELGTMTTLDSDLPVQPLGLGHAVVAVSAGGDHTCALTSTNGVLCWGGNYFHALGSGDYCSGWCSTPCRVPGLSSSTGFFPGDVNVDGSVTSVDAVLVLQSNAGRIIPCPYAGDVNGDGKPTSVDAALILQYVAGLIARLPP